MRRGADVSANMTCGNRLGGPSDSISNPVRTPVAQAFHIASIMAMLEVRVPRRNDRVQMNEQRSGTGLFATSAALPCETQRLSAHAKATDLVKLGLISDVHGNSVALRGCLDVLAETEHQQAVFPR